MTNRTSYKYFPVFLVGAIDGIIVPLTIYAFFIRVLENQTHAFQITVAGGSVLALMLGIGAYFTRKTEMENAGHNRLQKIYDSLDVSDEIKNQMQQDTIQENTSWQKEWKDGGNATGTLSPTNYALIVGLAYLSGLAVVLLSVLLAPGNGIAFMWGPFALLAALGFTKFKLAGQNPLVGMLTILAAGAVAVMGNWFVAGLF